MDDDQRLAEIDRLLNDPDSRMEPERVWMLLEELARRSVPANALPRQSGTGPG